MCRTTATTTLRNTRPRRCCACCRDSHRPTCRLLRQCPTSRAVARGDREPPALSAPAMQAPLSAPPLNPGTATRIHLLGALPLDQKFRRQPRLLLPPPQPTQSPPLLQQLLLLHQLHHHQARLSFCARGTVPVRAGPRGVVYTRERGERGEGTAQDIVRYSYCSDSCVCGGGGRGGGAPFLCSLGIFPVLILSLLEHPTKYIHDCAGCPVWHCSWVVRHPVLGSVGSCTLRPSGFERYFPGGVLAPFERGKKNGTSRQLSVFADWWH